MTSPSGRTDSRAVPASEPAQLVADFVTRGLVVLPPEALGIPASIHERLYARQQQALHAKTPINSHTIPEILDVLAAPGLVAACNRLLGRNFAIVPFTHHAPFLSGSNDQHWHKDDNGPYNGRWQRHHQVVQVELLYYPQAVEPDMGPTAIVPYSQYFTFDHEENHDNFAGADHLDFNYQLDGMERLPVSGPKSTYAPEDIVAGRTAHDRRMREAVTNLQWPFNEAHEAAPLRAGSVVLYSHNLFHRGNHRRDDFQLWRQRPRFMWRFWLYRTTDPADAAEQQAATFDVDLGSVGVDTFTGHDRRNAPEALSAIWRHQYAWSRGRTSPAPVVAPAASLITELKQALYASGDTAEPSRIGAAYRLAAFCGHAVAIELLSEALCCHRESVRRAATYGLVAAGNAATPVFLAALASPVKWLRKAGAHGLGDAAQLSDETLHALTACLRSDPSVYVRSVAAGSLGCIGRRAIATGRGATLVAGCVGALLDSLAQETNRLGMNIAQGRSIKFVRPTDACDVCEGIGINPVPGRFQPVRSAVRENALWSLVILCSHGPAVLGNQFDRCVAVLGQIVRDDANVFCAGLAIDALGRLGHLRASSSRGGPEALDAARAAGEAFVAALRTMPTHSWESLPFNGAADTPVVAEVERLRVAAAVVGSD